MGVDTHDRKVDFPHPASPKSKMMIGFSRVALASNPAMMFLRSLALALGIRMSWSSFDHFDGIRQEEAMKFESLANDGYS